MHLDTMAGHRLPRLLLPVVAVLLLASPSRAQLQVCPQVRSPCICDSSVYEPVSISCDRVQSLSQALQLISGASSTKIDRLSITNTPISQLPAQAFQGLRVTSLVLKKNGMTSIDPRAFDGDLLDTLTELSLEDNEFREIPQSGVTQLRSLRKLIIKNNKIDALPTRAFFAFASKALLEKLDLSGNQLSGIGTVSLEGLTGLKEISFEKNQFMAIPSQGLGVLRDSLENLNLGLNLISDVPVGSLDFPNLKSLSLEFNSAIQYISPDAFRGIPNMLYLYLGGNKFSSFDPEMFRNVPRLEILGLGAMAIRRIPQDAFRYITSLRRLEMSEAAVDDIQQGAFQRVANTIQAIVLNRNQLQRVRVDMFQNLPRLQSLDLQGNTLSVVDNGAWANLTSLRHLDISNNNLQYLEPLTFINTFQPTQESRTLYSCGNPWVCDQRLEWFRNWLRNERDIVIDKPPACTAVCQQPQFLQNVFLRDPDPAPSIPDPGPAGPTATMSSIGWIILAIILAILLTSIALLALARYFVGRRRRRDKEKDEEERILRSSASGYQTAAGAGSIVGSAYPTSGVDLDLPPATSLDMEQRNYWAY